MVCAPLWGGAALRFAAAVGLSGLAWTGAMGVAHAQNATAGSGSVGPSGAFSYSIPVRLPPGTAGVRPTIALTYSSQSGNGLAGVGWNLSGVSTITRCPANRATDGVGGTVTLTSSDKLCLDGQRLIYHSGGSGYGTAGAIYHTEMFNGSQVIGVGTVPSAPLAGAISRSAGGVNVKGTMQQTQTVAAQGGGTQYVVQGASKPTSLVSAADGNVQFRVRTKAGEVMEYIDAPYNVTINGTAYNAPRMWLLSRVADVKGNYFDVVYNYDDVSGEYTVNTIRYTGNGLKALAPYNQVRFEYENRPDTTVGYLGGAKLSSTQRLKAITVWYSAQGGALTKMADYQLAYIQSSATGRSLLSSVTERAFAADGSSTSLNPLVFSYAQDGPASSSTLPRWTLNNFDWGYVAGRGWVDMTGAGKSGFCRVVGNPGSYQLRCSPPVTGGSSFGPDLLSQAFSFDPTRGGYYTDVNGDGVQDFCRVSADFGANQSISCLMGPISGAMTDVQTGAIDIGFPDGRAFVDADGDGRADFCRILGTNRATGGSAIVCTLYNGTNFGGTTFSSPYYIDPGWDSSWPDTPVELRGTRWWIDLDGDGRTDFCRIVGRNPYYMRCSFGPNFELAKDIEVAIDPGYKDGRQWVDVNGDGKLDFCRINGLNPYYLQCAKWNGRTFVDDVMLGGTTIEAGYPNGRAWVDVNGDGLPDFCRVVDAYTATGYLYGVRCRLAPTFAAATEVYYAVFNDPGYIDTREWVDPVGDGKPRYCFITGSTNGSGNQAGCFGPPLSRTDLLTQVTSGLGLKTTLTYMPLAASLGDRYNKTWALTYPQQLVTPPLAAVVTMTSDVPGGSVSKNYWYYNAVNTLDGRGFAGFGSVLTSDTVTNILSLNSYNVVWPLTGSMLTSQTIKPGWAGSLARSDTSHGMYTLNPVTGSCTMGCTNGGVCVVVPTTTNSKAWDLNGAALPQNVTSTTPDCYGSPVTVISETFTGTAETTVASGNAPTGQATGYKNTTINTFMYNTDKWWIGRLLRSTVTNQKPAD